MAHHVLATSSSTLLKWLLLHPSTLKLPPLFQPKRLALLTALIITTAIQHSGFSATQGIPRSDSNSKLAHEHLLIKRKLGRIDLYFVGDSITRRWGCSDPQYQHLYENWKANFHGWNAANFGWGSDKVENILWRLENGELEGVHPKVIILLAGTNNLDVNSMAGPGADAKVEEVFSGIRAIVASMRRQAPEAQIIIMGILPRSSPPAGLGLNDTIERINKRIMSLVDGKHVSAMNLRSQLVTKDGNIRDGMMDDGVHLTVKGYQVWADALRPVLTRLLGPRSEQDLAPPPTGDPSLLPQKP